MTKIVIPLGMALAVAPSLLFANDSSFGGSGALPMPIHSNAVEMVKESIIIRGYQLDSAKVEWRVQCDFTFKNLNNNTHSLQMGFPLSVRQDDGDYSIPSRFKAKLGDPLVYDFHVAVNGVQVLSKRQSISSNEKLGLPYKTAYLWGMTFKPKQEIHVKHNYVLGVSYDAMGYVWVDYVLKTGGLWKGGAIGHTHIEVVPGVPTRLCSEVSKQSYDYLKAQPPGMKIVKQGRTRKYVWNLSDFKPTKDLRLCLQTGRDYVRHNIVYRIIDHKIRLESLSRQQLQLLRNTIYAQYGRPFKSPSLQAYFDRQWWYQKNPEYSDSLLMKFDREALQKILRAER